MGKQPNSDTLARARACSHPEGVSEKVLEASLRKEVKAMGGEAVKLTSQFHRGLPDRLVLMPQGLVYFVELKSTGKRPTGLQIKTHGRLVDLGYPVMVVSTRDELDTFLQLIHDEQVIFKHKKEYYDDRL